jgi:hypothetical protein
MTVITAGMRCAFSRIIRGSSVSVVTVCLLNSQNSAYQSRIIVRHTEAKWQRVLSLRVQRQDHETDDSCSPALCGSCIIIYISLRDAVLWCSRKIFTFYRLRDCGFVKDVEFTSFYSKKDAEVLTNGRAFRAILYTERSTCCCVCCVRVHSTVTEIKQLG